MVHSGLDFGLEASIGVVRCRCFRAVMTGKPIVHWVLQAALQSNAPGGAVELAGDGVGGGVRARRHRGIPPLGAHGASLTGTALFGEVGLLQRFECP